MLEHRRNGWYVLGGAMIAGGVAWLAAWGVAVDGANPPHSLRYWVWASYVALGVVVAGLLVVVTVMYDLPARLPRLNPRKTGLPLKVVAGEPHYHDWNYAASVAVLPIVVTNRTSAPVTLVGGLKAQLDHGDTPLLQGRLTQDEQALFVREVESQKRTSHHRPNLTEGATIPAHASLELWYVTAVSRDQRGARPGVRLYFNDSDGNEYSAVFKRFEPHKAQTEPPMMRAPDHGTV